MLAQNTSVLAVLLTPISLQGQIPNLRYLPYGVGDNVLVFLIVATMVREVPDCSDNIFTLATLKPSHCSCPLSLLTHMHIKIKPDLTF